MKQLLNSEFFTGQSMAGDFVTPWVKTTLCKTFNISLYFDGTPNGEFTLETSNDVTNKAELVEEASAQTYPNSAQSISGAGDHLYNVNTRLKWTRIRYTRTSGDGTCRGVAFGVEEY